MRNITGRHLLCLFLLAFPLAWAEISNKGARKPDNNTESNTSGEVQPIVPVWSQAKTRRLFARQKISPAQEGHVHRNKSHLMAPARRCGRLMESCSSHMPCCDPCASCRCRLFNTICHCWRINPVCLKRT